MPEAVWFKLCGDGYVVHGCVELLLCLGGRDVADGFEQASIVEPVDPFELGVVASFEAAPWSASMDYLGLGGVDKEDSQITY